jgi:thiamine biosynthesis lipoprotein
MYRSLQKIFLLILILNCLPAKSQQRFRFSEPKMGSPFNLTFYAGDSAKAEQLAAAAFRLVDSLNAIFSDYLPDSELNQLSLTAGTDSFFSASPLLFEVVARSKKASLQSNQAFDITIGPLSRLWRNARREKRFPSSREVMEAKKLTGMNNIILEPAQKRIKLLLRGMQLDLGGIAKGYVAQQVILFLQQQGIPAALADAGGDLVCSDPPPGKQGWLIGINRPGSETELIEEKIAYSHGAVATSGDLYQYLEHEGKRYSHIIDPRTGLGVPFQRNVTILAPDGATADWLATACSILPVSKCKKLVKQHGGGLLITELNKKGLRYIITSGIKKRFVP